VDIVLDSLFITLELKLMFAPSSFWISIRPITNYMLPDTVVGRCGVVGSTLTFGSICHGFESEDRLFSDYGA